MSQVSGQDPSGDYDFAQARNLVLGDLVMHRAGFGYDLPTGHLTLWLVVDVWWEDYDQWVTMVSLKTMKKVSNPTEILKVVSLGTTDET